MGVVLSYIKPPNNEPDAITGLTPREKSLVTSSWALVSKDLVGNGVKLLMIFFRREPKYQSYFPFKDVPFEELPNSTLYKAHCTNVMYAVASIVDNVNNGEVLVELLKKTGVSHSRRNIPKESFKTLQESVLELLRKGLGPKITQEGLNAWDKTLTVAFSVIVSTLHTTPENA